MSGWPEEKRCPEFLRQNIWQDIKTDKDSATPENQRENRIEKQQFFIRERSAFAPVQFINMLLALSNKVFYIIGHALGRQIYFEIPINSIGRDTPLLCRFAKRIIYAEAGY
jgi:hypothetical protein